MTTAVQHRRGTTAEHSSFTGLEGEVTIDTTKDTAVIHDGTLAGGYPLAKENLANVTPASLGALTGASTAADDEFLVYDTSASSMKKISRAELNNAMTLESLDTVDINGGTVDGTTIGGTTAAAGSFTTLNASSTTTLNGTTIPASVTLVSTVATQTLTGKTISADNNTLSGIAASSFVLSNGSGNIDGAAAQKAIPAGVVVGTTDTQTLTNKTLGATVVDVNSSSTALRITQTGSGNALVVEDSTNPDSTPFVVDASGNAVVGHTTALSIDGATTALQVYAGGGFQTNGRFDNTASAPVFRFVKSRGANIGTNTLVAQGDGLGTILFVGADGTSYIQSAFITGAVDGTPGTNDMPGRLVFGTAADGASTPTERYRINNAGTHFFGNTTTNTNSTMMVVNGEISETTGGTQYKLVNQSDIGTAPNEVPLNGYLGGMAFQSPEGVVISGGTGAFTTLSVSSSVTLSGGTANGVLYLDGSKVATSGSALTFDGSSMVLNTSTSGNALRITQAGTGNALVVEDSTNPDSTPVVIDNNGRTIIGYTALLSTGVGTPSLHTIGASASAAMSASTIFSNDTGGSSYVLGKSRGAIGSVGTPVLSGDTVGIIYFVADDGTALIRAAQITGAVDGTPGTNDMPGRLVFSTTADGASSPTERMRIDSAGNVGIGIASSAGYSILSQKNITGATTAYGMANAGVVQSDVTTTVNYFYTSGKTAAAAFTLANMQHFTAAQSTFGAGSTVTNQYGFNVTSTLTGATNNYGFYSNIATGTGRWNFYANGTAANYFAGNVLIGTTTAGASKLTVADDSIQVNTAKTPASASATGTTGQIAWDSDYVYVCVATNTWKRSALSTW